MFALFIRDSQSTENTKTIYAILGIKDMLSRIFNSHDTRSVMVVWTPNFGVVASDLVKMFRRVFSIYIDTLFGNSIMRLPLSRNDDSIEGKFTRKNNCEITPYKFKEIYLVNPGGGFY